MLFSNQSLFIPRRELKVLLLFGLLLFASCDSSFVPDKVHLRKNLTEFKLFANGMLLPWKKIRDLLRLCRMGYLR